MDKKKRSLVALLLAVVLLLNGCDGLLTEYLDSALGYAKPTPYKEMEYTRPNMIQLQKLLNVCRANVGSGDVDTVVRDINRFYSAYDSFHTNYSLADIRYCGDLTDEYWEAEYNFCMENAPAADAALDELYRILARSPMRDALEGENYFGAGFFDAYDGESAQDEHYLDLLEQEAALISRYYDLSDQALETTYYSEEYFSAYGTQMAQLFVELIALRQEIAAYVGYPSYPAYAYDFYFWRDYTPAEAEVYLEEVSKAFYDIYCQINASDIWDLGYAPCGETATFQYVKDAAQAMGGDIADAFALLEETGTYDIAFGENKYASSFETYLWSYGVPFIFMNPYLDQTDKLTFAHEFGHFANDYVCGGSYAGTDIAEVHSQAFEYLSLCYSEASEDLAKYKMADSLCVYMECAAFALFEHQVYSLTGDDLTAENVAALYRQIGIQFGFDSWDWDPRDYVTVTHFYTNPMYNISYVVSNDLAMQFYQLEQAEAGKGLELYNRCLYSEDSLIIAFAQDYGLESPFAQGRLEETADTFRAVLQGSLR